MRAISRKLYAIWDMKLKILAMLLIFALAFADFLTMNNLFTQLHLSDSLYVFGVKLPISEITIYSFTMAILLEGNPTFLGIAASIMFDNTKYNTNDKMNARLGFFVALIGLCLTFALVMVLRYLIMYMNGGWQAFKSQLYGGKIDRNVEFIAQIYLFSAPILTSLLAFVASWTAFRTESIEKLERKIDKLHKKYLMLQSEFLDTLHKNEDAKMALWTSLAVRARIPKEFSVFRKECFERIRSKLLVDCNNVFPSQMERFNAEVEGELIKYIEVMAKLTTTPMDISSMELRDVIEQYDALQKLDITAWNYERSGKKIEEEFMKLINNAIVVAQFKTASRPYHMEGDW